MYQVIARKYRPQTFAELISQEHVRTTLENAISQNRIAHGYIFSGQRGTGKTTVARIMARCLNCEKGPTITPCGVCASCTEIAAGSGMDVIEIYAASNRGINEMRELRENVRYRPARDRFKVFIIDDLDKAVKEGGFREDLFFRLNVIQIEIPPLRERTEDVTILAERLLGFFGQARHHLFLGFTPEALQALKQYHWPGNLRELRNVVERAAILCQTNRVGVECLPENLLPNESGARLGDRVPLEKIEEEHIRRVLATTKSLQEAADILGIDQATLWRRRKKYGI